MRASATTVGVLTIAVVVAGCGSTEKSSEGSSSSGSTRTVTQTQVASTTPTRTPATSTSVAVAADPAAYEVRGGHYFTSPSGKWSCAILTISDPVAGCHGPIPKKAPDAPRGDGSPAHPNTVLVAKGSPARFQHRGDPAYTPTDGKAKVLPYRETLTVAGMSCSVSKASGVTCRDNQGHSFTISASTFQLQ